MLKVTTAVLSLLFMAALTASAQTPEQQSTNIIITLPPGANVDVQGSAAQARMRPPGVTGSFDCSCEGGQGTCTLEITSNGLFCLKKAGDTCSGGCDLTVSTPSISGVGGVIAR
jgi:hypothetical protein